MAQDVTRITLSTAQVWYASAGSTFPANSTAVGASWGAEWTKLGYTESPVTFEYSFDIVEADIQESLAVVKRAKSKEAAMLETVIAELDLNQFKLAMEGTVSATGSPANDTMDMGGYNTLTERAWGFEGTWVNSSGTGYPVRLFIYKGSSQAGGQLAWDKAKYLGLPLKIKALADMTKTQGSRLFKLVQVTGA